MYATQHTGNVGQASVRHFALFYGTLTVSEHIVTLCSTFATFCDGYGFFATEYTGTLELCLANCKNEAHPVPGVQCFGVEYSRASAHCYYYSRDEVTRCPYQASLAYQVFTYVGCP